MTIEAAPKEYAKMVKGCEQETFIDAWMRFLPLPATYDKKAVKYREIVKTERLPKGSGSG